MQILDYKNDVFNQTPAFENYNIYTSDVPLQNAVRKNGGEWINERASVFGEVLGRAETLKLGDTANIYTPILKTHDRFGNRADLIEYHPAYHDLIRLSIENETHCLAWTSEQKGAQVARSALMFLRHQVDEGSSCPLTMTFAAVPSLKIEKKIADEWIPLVLSNEYDARFIPADEKRGTLFGMAMTERQGGSDVRANTTVANKISETEYEITGHKWFCSAPMSDAFLVLAQTNGGLSCFIMSRFTPDGKKNRFYIERLKDKLGNRSNASCEIEFQNAHAKIIGEEGRGVANIIEMVRHTRLDCVTGSAATLRRAVAESLHHTKHRKTFGKFLIEHDLMQNVLADLCLESEAATALAFRLSRSFDESEIDEHEKYFSRIATAIGKFWVTKRAVFAVPEALECLGGNGYVEESIMPRLYRDVPVNSIWEGSGNVQCLDVLRAFSREPQTIEVLRNELKSAFGANDIYDKFVGKIERELTDFSNMEIRARRIVEMLALGLQAKVLIETAPDCVSDAFCNSRLNENGFLTLGTLSANTNFREIIKRNMPEIH